ncbi:alpha/beta fold hydrolase [Streptomyces capparidis]
MPESDTARPGGGRWTPWHGSPRPSGGGTRVYCLPHAGGAASSYLPWAEAAGETGLEFVPVELPGRGTRWSEEPCTRMDDLVDGFLAVLADAPPGAPFILFGHSMGALVGYEAARRLAGAGAPTPLGLVVSGRRPPRAPEAVPMHGLPDDDLLATLAELGGTPPEVLRHEGLMRMALPALRADLTLLAEHNARVPITALPCPVLALTGTDDVFCDPRWAAGWRAATGSDFRRLTFPGGHFFLHEHRAAIAAEIGRMAGAAARRSRG